MYDDLSLGPVPCDEECQQVGTPSYDPIAARQECRRYIEVLKRVHGEPPPGAFYRITSNPHDFGMYYDVCIRFDEDNEAACEYAYKVEANCPATWGEGEEVPAT